MTSIRREPFLEGSRLRGKTISFEKKTPQEDGPLWRVDYSYMPLLHFL